MSEKRIPGAKVVLSNQEQQNVLRCVEKMEMECVNFCKYISTLSQFEFKLFCRKIEWNSTLLCRIHDRVYGSLNFVIIKKVTLAGIIHMYALFIVLSIL